jgi:hypothetical protein
VHAGQATLLAELVGGIGPLLDAFEEGIGIDLVLLITAKTLVTPRAFSTPIHSESQPP